MLRQLFHRKSISVIESTSGGPQGLRKVLGAWDLILLAIGAVIGAGIFSTVGTAAAGEFNDGVMVRAGAGPALILSFLLLGFLCTLAGLCYAELSSLIPHAGSAYGYTYATLGQVVAWIVGWDLILEYAVGNVGVAISWADYVKSFLTECGVPLPDWLSTGYRTALLSADPVVHGLLETAPRPFGFPILVNLPAFGIVGVITFLLLLGAREGSRWNHVLVVIKLVALAVFVFVGVRYFDQKNFTPFAPHGWQGIHQGAAIVFFAYIGFDAVSTAAEETRNPQRNLPIGILVGLGICTLIYIIVGTVLVGMAPAEKLGVGNPLTKALELAGVQSKSANLIVAGGAALSTAAVLFVFQYGQPRILFAMARDRLLPSWAAKVHPRTGVPHLTTLATGAVVGIGALLGDANETYDLCNIGTLFAFAIVCLGVLVLRIREPNRTRPFRVPLVWVVAPLGAAACFYVMAGLPASAWIRFGWWLGIGMVIYFCYGFHRSQAPKE